MNSGLLASLLFGLALFLVLPAQQRLPRAGRLALLLACLVLVALPLGQISIAGYLRSITSDPAVVTVLLAAWGAFARVRSGAATPLPTGTLALFGGLGVLLYPSALGLTYFDVYRLGYAPQALMAAIGVLALACAATRRYLLALALCAATLAFTLEVTESDNYWDYLLDPLLVGYCWIVLLVRGCRQALMRRTNSAASARDARRAPTRRGFGTPGAG